ncbi:MAG: hypothetical protein GY940_10135 [bacterium]|nr:hypothetical protein [bacterium]
MKNHDDKIDEMLENLSPPDAALPAAKAMLRRELLNSSHFKPKPPVRVFRKYALISVPVLGVFLLMVVLKFTQGEMSAMARLEYLESTYYKSFISDTVHYLKARFSETVKTEGHVVVEQWRYGADKVRILLKYQESQKIVGHLILKGKQAFLWLDEDSEAKILVTGKQGEDCTEKDDNTEEVTNNAYSTMVVPVENIPAGKPGIKQVVVIISKDSIDLFGFATSDPAKIFSRLKASPDLAYAGTDTLTDSRGKRRLEMFERKTSQDLRAFLVEYNEELEKDLEVLVEKLLKQRIEFHSQSGDNLNRDGTDAEIYADKGGFEIEKIDVVETTKVDKDTGMISSIIQQAYRRGKPMAKHELTFLKEQFLVYEPGIFDENRFQLKELRPGQLQGTGAAK